MWNGPKWRIVKIERRMHFPTSKPILNDKTPKFTPEIDYCVISRPVSRKKTHIVITDFLISFHIGLPFTLVWLLRASYKHQARGVRRFELPKVNGKPVWNEIRCKFYRMCNFSPKIGLKMLKEAISYVILNVLSFKMGVDVWKYILISLSTIRNLDPFQTGLLFTIVDYGIYLIFKFSNRIPKR